mmetsp:Transcript_16232/g.37395  ORF Transcript_16232/g.37395 Transcript_16232/m.37395 type:complete len:461 (-) Transcript_16232:25-1407(-)
MFVVQQPGTYHPRGGLKHFEPHPDASEAYAPAGSLSAAPAAQVHLRAASPVVSMRWVQAAEPGTEPLDSRSTAPRPATACPGRATWSPSPHEPQTVWAPSPAGSSSGHARSTSSLLGAVPSYASSRSGGCGSHTLLTPGSIELPFRSQVTNLQRPLVSRTPPAAFARTPPHTSRGQYTPVAGIASSGSRTPVLQSAPRLASPPPKQAIGASGAPQLPPNATRLLPWRTCHSAPTAGNVTPQVRPPAQPQRSLTPQSRPPPKVQPACASSPVERLRWKEASVPSSSQSGYSQEAVYADVDTEPGQLDQTMAVLLDCGGGSPDHGAPDALQLDAEDGQFDDPIGGTFLAVVDCGGDDRPMSPLATEAVKAVCQNLQQEARAAVRPPTLLGGGISYSWSPPQGRITEDGPLQRLCSLQDGRDRPVWASEAQRLWQCRPDPVQELARQLYFDELNGALKEGLCA